MKERWNIHDPSVSEWLLITFGILVVIVPWLYGLLHFFFPVWII